uniref:Uncharacterized protein n=1 Tax=viral metagenome TaxID=1070528 RepID=A0A6C0CAK0_9ZZZZ
MIALLIALFLTVSAFPAHFLTWPAIDRVLSGNFSKISPDTIQYYHSIFPDDQSDSKLNAAPSFNHNPFLTSTSWSIGDFYLTFFKDGVGNLFTLNTTQEIMIDGSNQRYVVKTAGFGDQYTFTNGSYFVTPDGLGGTICSFTSMVFIGNQSATYSGQVETYKRSLLVDNIGVFLNQGVYVAQAYDVGACGQPLSNIQVLTPANVQYKNWFTQQSPGSPDGSGGCLPSFASVFVGSYTSTFMRSYLPPTHNAFFTLPAQCLESGLPDFCANACYCWTYPCS